MITFYNGIDIQNIIKGITACLDIVQQKGYESVAFPAFGCGNLATPPEELAHCFLTVAQQYPGVKVC